MKPQHSHKDVEVKSMPMLVHPLCFFKNGNQYGFRLTSAYWAFKVWDSETRSYYVCICKGNSIKLVLNPDEAKRRFEEVDPHKVTHQEAWISKKVAFFNKMEKIDNWKDYNDPNLYKIIF